MFVANRMTKHPVTVTPDTSIDRVISLMKKNHIHRMPVVENGQLVGFFSDRDIVRVMPSPATTLSRFEEKSLLGKITVREIMKTNVISVSDEATIEEAALIMYNNKIGGLPVTSSVGALVGVITGTDILKTFVDVMGLANGKTRLTIETDDKLGVVNDISGIFTAHGFNIDSLVTCKQDNGKYEIVIRGDIPDEQDIKAQIEAKGYNVIHTVKIG